jgi:hypothetical protein
MLAPITGGYKIKIEPLFCISKEQHPNRVAEWTLVGNYKRGDTRTIKSKSQQDNQHNDQREREIHAVNNGQGNRLTLLILRAT